MQVNLNYQDQLEQEKADARNAVEEYVYSMRDKLYELGEYITDEDKEVFSGLLMKTEDWLYDEGEDQPKKVYVEKLVELRKHGDPVIQREKEFLERPTAFNELASAIIHYEKILQSFDSGVCRCDGGHDLEKLTPVWLPHAGGVVQPHFGSRNGQGQGADHGQEDMVRDPTPGLPIHAQTHYGSSHMHSNQSRSQGMTKAISNYLDLLISICIIESGKCL